MVSKGYSVDFVMFFYFFEEVHSDFAGFSFHTGLVLEVCGVNEDRNIVFKAEFLYESFVEVGVLTSEMVVDMSGHDGEVVLFFKFEEHINQGSRISAAREADQDFGVILKQSILFNERDEFA